MRAQLYAYRYPAEVVGLVLVDGESEDEDSALDAVTGGKMTQFNQQAVAWIDSCVKEAQAGQASHLIQFDKPDAVSDAVIEVVKRLH